MSPATSVVIHGTGPVTVPQYLSLVGIHLVGVVGVGVLVYWMLASRS
jgi:hypothetical protein